MITTIAEPMTRIEAELCWTRAQLADSRLDDTARAAIERLGADIEERLTAARDAAFADDEGALDEALRAVAAAWHGAVLAARHRGTQALAMLLQAAGAGVLLAVGAGLRRGAPAAPAPAAAGGDARAALAAYFAVGRCLGADQFPGDVYTACSRSCPSCKSDARRLAIPPGTEVPRDGGRLDLRSVRATCSRCGTSEEVKLPSDAPPLTAEAAAGAWVPLTCGCGGTLFALAECTHFDDEDYWDDAASACACVDCLTPLQLSYED